MNNFYDEDNFYHKSNRDQSHDPKSHTKHWCGSCDAEIVNDGEKCPRCGAKSGDRFKKPCAANHN